MAPAAPPPVEAAFRGDPGARVLTFTHPPSRPSGAGAVLCSPIGAEQVQNQKREQTLAAALARRGVLVRRFHFRGTGDSDDASLTLDSMGEDAALAARELIDSGEIDRVAFVGTRLAATAAARAAGRHEQAPLAIWEPVVDPGSYFEEIFRYELVHELMHAKRGGKVESRSLRGDLEVYGRADVLGFPVSRALYEGSLGRRLAAELAHRRGPSLLVQIRRQAGLAKEYEALVGELGAQGVELEVRTFRGNIPWWFLAKQHDSQVDEEALVATTVDWLSSHLLAG